MTKENKLLLTLSIACAIALAVMVIALCMTGGAEQKPFESPPFDTNAVEGEPSVSQTLGYSVLYQDGMSFKVGICGNVNIKGSTADVYFTNVSENALWLKLRVLDSKGDIIGESGLIKPGEYLKSVELNSSVKADERVTLKIMSYEPDTYYSLGAITLTPALTIEQ